MSFILDALKKSENERQRHQGPSLVDVPTRRAQSERPWWVVLLAALLVLNLVVFVVVLLRKDKEPVAASAPVAAAPAAPVNQPSPRPVTPRASSASQPTPAIQTDPTVRSLAEEAGVDDSDEGAPAADPALADAAAAVPSGPPIVSPIQGPNAAPVRSLPSGVRYEENLPTINDLTATGAAQLPAMHLDIHVYATAPADRFVFINMKKYREGETTSEGMTVEQIRRDGVVLNHQGMRFVLPRQ